VCISNAEINAVRQKSEQERKQEESKKNEKYNPSSKDELGQGIVEENPEPSVAIVYN